MLCCRVLTQEVDYWSMNVIVRIRSGLRLPYVSLESCKRAGESAENSCLDVFLGRGDSCYVGQAVVELMP